MNSKLAFWRTEESQDMKMVQSNLVSSGRKYIPRG